MRLRFGLGLLVLLAVASVGSLASAQGFALLQHEPVGAAEQGFAVSAPWYAPTRVFAASLTLDYGHDVLQGGTLGADGAGQTIIDHQLAGHLDVAYSPWERLSFSLSLPVTLSESGDGRMDVAPISGMAVGDPRFGVNVRLFGDALQDAISGHVSGMLWVPIAAEDDHAGDQAARGRIGAVLAGHVADHLAWAANAGFLFRKQAGLNARSTGPGTVGDELQLGARVGYASSGRDFHVGPEATFGTIIGDHRAFKDVGSHLELLLGTTYWFTPAWQFGAAVGAGLVRTPGTPDVRGLLRVAYAPSFEQAPEPEAEPAPTAEPAPEPEPQVAVAPEPVAPEPAPEPVVEPAPEPAPEAVAAAPEPVEPEPTPEPPAPALPELPRIQFARNRATATQKGSLDRAARILKAHPDARVAVVGHSDDTGPAEFNQSLSEERARFVADQLAERGVSSDRLEVRGVGSSQPRDPSGTEAARSKNRRVELVEL